MKNVFKILFLAPILLVSCDNNPLEIDTSSTHANFQFKHYEKALFEMDQSQLETQLDELAKEFPPFFDGNYKDPAKIFGLKEYLNNDLSKKLYNDWGGKINNYEKIKKDLQAAFNHYSYYYPDDSIPTIYTYISGLNYEEPIMTAPGGIIIGIDMFYGKNYGPYKKLQIPDYIRKNYEVQFISPMLMRKIAKVKFSQSLSGENMLENMIALGKVEYFIEAMMPSMPDSLRFQFTSKQMQWCYGKEAAFWKHLTTKKLLFSKDYFEYKKFLEPAPFSSSLERDSPGRSGIFIGYRIVKSYMERNSDVSLQELMTESDFNHIFKESKYKP